MKDCSTLLCHHIPGGIHMEWFYSMNSTWIPYIFFMDSMQFQVDSIHFHMDSMQFQVDFMHFHVDFMHFHMDSIHFHMDSIYFFHGFYTFSPSIFYFNIHLPNKKYLQKKKVLK